MVNLKYKNQIKIGILMDKILITTKKLENIVIIKKNIKYIRDKIELIDAQLFKCNISNYSYDKKSYNDCIKEELIDKKLELVKIIDNANLELNCLKNAIDLLNGIEKKVLVDIYMNGKSIAKIAKEERYSESYIRKIRVRAIEHMSVILFGVAS